MKATFNESAVIRFNSKKGGKKKEEKAVALLRIPPSLPRFQEMIKI